MNEVKIVNEKEIVFGEIFLEKVTLKSHAEKARKKWQEIVNDWAILEAASKKLGPLPNEFKPAVTKSGVQVWTSEWRARINETWYSFDLVSGAQICHTYTSRIGEQFSGAGSSDGMRDAYETKTIIQKNEYIFPRIRSMYNGKYREYNVEKIYSFLKAIT